MVKISLINPRPNRICSIDASTNSLAFAIFNGNSLEKFGKIKFSGATTYDKTGDAARKTFAFLKAFDIDSIVIEHTVFMNSPKTQADLALVQGAILGAAQMLGIHIAGSVNPITWQSFIGNKNFTKEEKLKIKSENNEKSASWIKNFERDGRKQRIINFVNTYYDKNISDNDVADAVGIGHWAINNWGKLTK